MRDACAFGGEPISRYLREKVEVLPDTATCREAAERMRETGASYVVVVSGWRPSEKHPLGVLTGRDLAVRVIAEGLDPEALRIEEVMHPLGTSASRDADVATVLHQILNLGTGCVPIVDDDQLVGVALLKDLAAELGLRWASPSESA